jgi:hypothetical protein
MLGFGGFGAAGFGSVGLFNGFVGEIFLDRRIDCDSSTLIQL